MRLHTAAVQTPHESLHYKLTGRKLPCHTWESDPHQYCTLAFCSDALQTDMLHPWYTIKLTPSIFTSNVCTETCLRLDDVFLHTVCIQPGNVNLAVKMANVTDDAIFQHLLKVMRSQDGLAACCSHVNSRLVQCVVNGGHFITWRRKNIYYCNLWQWKNTEEQLLDELAFKTWKHYRFIF